MELLDALNWRYAAKKMNGQSVPAEKVDKILEAIRLSASSVGIQPYNVIVVENQDLRGKIHEQACPQPQIVEGSHVLIFASWTDVDTGRVNEYMKLIADTRHTTVDSLTPFANSIKGNLLSRTPEARAEWAARQSYIALGTAIIAAATEGVDATPMEGFNADTLDQLLDLPAKGMHSVSILVLGYRDTEKDFLATAPKVRRSKEALFVEMA